MIRLVTEDSLRKALCHFSTEGQDDIIDVIEGKRQTLIIPTIFDPMVYLVMHQLKSWNEEPPILVEASRHYEEQCTCPYCTSVHRRFEHFNHRRIVGTEDILRFFQGRAQDKKAEDLWLPHYPNLDEVPVGESIYRLSRRRTLWFFHKLEQGWEVFCVPKTVCLIKQQLDKESELT